MFNMRNDSQAEDLITNLFISLKNAQLEGDMAIKLKNLYGSWGMTYAFHVGPYFWGIPLLITWILLVVFRRKRLLGVTQKFIMSIMIIDLIYTTISCVRDTLLRVFQMHYGFLEYRVCAEFMYSFRLQTICHTTSVWLKTLMSLHQVLLVGFPLKVKLYNLKVVFYSFLFFHIVYSVVFTLGLSVPHFEAIPLIQEYKHGFPLKKILACRLNSLSSQTMAPVTFVLLLMGGLYSQVIPFVLHFDTIVALVILLTRHIRTLSFLIHNVSVKRIKYVSLLKVNIGLGVSFFPQELPITFFSIYQIWIEGDLETYDKLYSNFQGVAIVVMCISFSLGKPIDVFIYASLSQSFKQEIRNLFKCFCRSSRQIPNNNSKIRSKTDGKKQEVPSRKKQAKCVQMGETVECTVSN